MAESRADPFLIGARIAFARRVGVLVGEGADAVCFLKGRRIRFRCFDLDSGKPSPDPESYLPKTDAIIDLQSPEYELTLIRGTEDYLAVTAPGVMLQGWAKRRPRRRPFFHPAAIFPKLSRALVNLTGCKEGDSFLDPFAGTGSIPMEAYLVGARVLAIDQSERMVRGAAANMTYFGQDWLGVLRADATRLPLTRVDAVATDIPYGRASSTGGREPKDILLHLLPTLESVMRQGTKLVIMHQKEVQVGGGSEFILKEEYDLHVHKLLTRTISVLRRR